MTPSTDYRLIPLTRGLFTKVSIHRFDEFSKHKWHAKQGHDSFYAERGVRIGQKIIHIKMHRLILGLESGDKRLPDHINGDTLDNRDGNLRIATASQNTSNSKNRRHNTSGYRWVSWHKRIGKWQAAVKHAGKVIALGYYDDPRQAHEEAKRLAVKLKEEYLCSR